MGPWKKVDGSNFKPHAHIAHKGFMNTIRNYINSQQYEKDLTEALKGDAHSSDDESEESFVVDDVIGSYKDNKSQIANALEKDEHVAPVIEKE